MFVLGNYKFVTETSSANTEKEVCNDTEAEMFHEPQHTVIWSNKTRNNHHKTEKVVDFRNYGLLLTSFQ